MEKNQIKRTVNAPELQEAAEVILEALKEKKIDFFVGIFAMERLVDNARKEFNFQSEVHEVKLSRLDIN